MWESFDSESNGLNPIRKVSKHTNKPYYIYNDVILKDYEPIPSYNNDWNSLMSVVISINKFGYFIISSGYCSIKFDDFGIMIRNTNNNIIDNVFDAVVKFSDFYLEKYEKPLKNHYD